MSSSTGCDPNAPCQNAPPHAKIAPKVALGQPQTHCMYKTGGAPNPPMRHYVISFCSNGLACAACASPETGCTRARGLSFGTNVPSASLPSIVLYASIRAHDPQHSDTIQLRQLDSLLLICDLVTQIRQHAKPSASTIPNSRKLAQKLLFLLFFCCMLANV
jgi:hypothetical protein